MRQLEKCDILMNLLVLLTCCKILFLCLICSLVIVLLIESVEIILQFDVFWENGLKMPMCQMSQILVMVRLCANMNDGSMRDHWHYCVLFPEFIELFDDWKLNVILVKGM